MANPKMKLNTIKELQSAIVDIVMKSPDIFQKDPAEVMTYVESSLRSIYVLPSSIHIEAGGNVDIHRAIVANVHHVRDTLKNIVEEGHIKEIDDAITQITDPNQTA